MSAEKYEPVIGGTFRIGGSAEVQEVRRTSDGARYVAKTLGTDWDTRPVLREINDPRQGLIPGHVHWFVEVDDWCFIPSREHPGLEQLRLFIPWFQPLDEVVMRRDAAGNLSDRPPTSDEQRRQRLGWVVDLAIGMWLLHAAETVHSDAHISNAFVDTALRARWGDLGAGDFYRQFFQQRSGVVGHASSCAPSVWSDGQCLAEDDLYSLAHTAATILRGSSPHVAYNNADMPPPAGQWPRIAAAAGLPEAVDDVIIRGAACEREGRYGSALDFARALLDAAECPELRAAELDEAEKAASHTKRMAEHRQVRAWASDEDLRRNTLDAPVLSAVLAAQADLQRTVAERDQRIEQLELELKLVRAQLERWAKRPIRSLFIRDEPTASPAPSSPREAPAPHPVRAEIPDRRDRAVDAGSAGGLRPDGGSERVDATARAPRTPAQLLPSTAAAQLSRQPTQRRLFESDERMVKPVHARPPRGRGPLRAYLLHRYILVQIDWCAHLLADLLDDTHRTWSIWELDGLNAKRCGRDELVGFLNYLDAWIARETHGRFVRSRRPSWRRRRELITRCKRTVPDDYDTRRARTHVRETFQLADPRSQITAERLAALILRDPLADQLDRMSDSLAHLAGAHREMPSLLRLQRLASIVHDTEWLIDTARRRGSDGSDIPYGWRPKGLWELSNIVRHSPHYGGWPTAVDELPDEDALKRCEALVAELRIPLDRIAGIDSPSLWVASARRILDSSEREIEILDGLPAAVQDSGHQKCTERREQLKALLDDPDRATPRELRDIESQAAELSLKGKGLKRAQNRAADHLLRTLTSLVDQAPATGARARLKTLCEGLTETQERESKRQEQEQQSGMSFDADGDWVTDAFRPLPGLSSSGSATVGMLLSTTLDGATLRERLTSHGSDSDKEMLAAFDVLEGALIQDPSQHWRLLEPLVEHRRAVIAHAAYLILSHTADTLARRNALEALFCAALAKSRDYRTGERCWTSADVNAELTAAWATLLDPLHALTARADAPSSTVDRVIASFGDSSDPTLAAMDIELLKIDRAEAELRSAAAPANTSEAAPFEAVLKLAGFLASVRDDLAAQHDLYRQAYEQVRLSEVTASTVHAWNLAWVGRPADAHAMIERVLAEAPTPNDLCAVARFKERYGARGQAEPLLREAIDIAVQHGPYWHVDECQLALARFLAGDADRQHEARMAFDRAFELSEWRAAEAFSSFLASIGELDEAEAVLVAGSRGGGRWTHLAYGGFLATVRRNPSAALEHYERVWRAEWPGRSPAIAANYAEWLLLTGSGERGDALAQRVLHQVAENSHLALAMQITRATIGPPAVRAAARKEAERIAQAGVNAGSWDFALVLERVASSAASWLNGLLHRL